jgi:proline dehydrogenase
MLSFENTEIAFSSKSNKELNWAYKLFQLVGNNTLVKLGKFLTTIALKLHLPIRGIVKKTIFNQFCGGETIQECENTIVQLNNFNIGTILDYSVEGKTTNKEFDETCKELLNAVEYAKKDSRIPFSVFKVSGLSSFSILEKTIEEQKTDPEFAKVVERIDKLCKASFEANTSILIDAEESWVQNTIDWIAQAMMEKYNTGKAIVYTTVQLYRHDRLDFIKESLIKAEKGNYKIGVKLVRGAYMEKERARAKAKNYPSPINKTKKDSDELYDESLVFCIKNINYISFFAGTHNEKSSLHLTKLMREANIDKSDTRIYFAQLLGMSDHISFNLSDAGYNVAKYVPYGPIKEVIPYLIRRAEENTSVAGQTSRELTLIKKEVERRKQIA